MFALFILLVILGVAFEETLGPILRDLEESLDGDGATDPESVVMIFVGIFVLVWGLSSFFYFTCSELFWRGQTIGKRSCKIRVVKADGFSLDPISILVRNIFRVADNLPMLWIVPVLSARCQRLGDMVAGTLVIREDPEDLPEVRSELAERRAAEATFRFDLAKLGKLVPSDFTAIEQILDRWKALSDQQRLSLLEKVVPSVCRKMQIEPPPANQRVAFLEDLLAAEYRRQDRHL
jgi:uncharacterized RDD family membrane protein YckC